ncbi:MAG: hypothetical protein AAFS12_16625 [Cyanobacteria bacterium J06632_19]
MRLFPVMYWTQMQIPISTAQQQKNRGTILTRFGHSSENPQ